MTKFLVSFFSILFISIPPLLAADYNFVSVANLGRQDVAKIILTKIYQKANLKIDIASMPGNRAHKMAVSGEKDGEILRIWSYGQNNPTVIRVPTPYYNLQTVAFGKKNNNIQISAVADLKKYRLAKVRGVKHTDNIAKDMPNIRNTSSLEDLINALHNGHVDLALSDSKDGLALLHKKKFTDIEIKGPSLASLDLFHYIHQKHRPLVAKIDAIIIAMKKSGELSDIIAQAEHDILAINH